MFVEVLPICEGSGVLMSVGLILAFPCIDLSRDCSVSRRVSVYPVFAYDFLALLCSRVSLSFECLCACGGSRLSEWGSHASLC